MSEWVGCGNVKQVSKYNGETLARVTCAVMAFNKAETICTIEFKS